MSLNNHKLLLIDVIEYIVAAASATSFVLRRCCTQQWRRNLRHFNSATLLRKLRFVVNKCSVRGLVLAFRRGVFNNDKTIFKVVIDELSARGVGAVAYVAEIVAAYAEINNDSGSSSSSNGK